MSRRSVRLALAAAVVLPGLDVAALDATSTFSCARHELSEPPQVVAKPSRQPAKAEPPPVVAKVEQPPPPPSPKEVLKAWLSARMPAGGELVEDGPGFSVTHTVKKGDTLLTVAAAYVDLTTQYAEPQLVNAIAKANPKLSWAPGTKIMIPSIVAEAPKPATETRLGWPKDDASLRGIYVNATMAGHPGFPGLLDNLAAHGLNAIVMDVKDVTGTFTYPSKVPLAIEVNANKHTMVSNFERFVRYVHTKGIRVVARVSCFRDEYVGPRRSELAVQKRGGGPHVAPSKVIDWLDPSNENVQAYLSAVVEEALGAGVDEIQLDYVRYPTEGVWDADFHLKEKKLAPADVITGFVKRIHEHTEKSGVPLSLDVFGVVAWRDPRDIEATGQDLRRLAPFIEAVSPMVYPSHFADGFNGYEHPGDHADVVAIGTKKAVAEIEAVSVAGGKKVVVRPWVQAFPWKTTVFGSAYVADQIKEAHNGGGVGWLAWNSGGEYGATFGAVPIKKTLVAAK
ncbi:MAG: putative glycoside hydrolase [Polyangiales bacterium]